MIFTKPEYKNTISAMLKISATTFCRWIKKYEKDLKKLGYKRNDKLLKPNQLNYLADKLGFTADDLYRKK